MEEEKVNWVDKMIEREALPLQLRDGTVAEFAKKYEIADSLYYYYSSKPEIKEKIIGIALNNAKKHAPEVLENLGERAKSNNADAKTYLQFILQLAEKTDITSNGKAIQIVIPQAVVDTFDINANTNEEAGGSNTE